MYSTEEWMRDNGVTNDDLINIYTAPKEDENKQEQQEEAKYKQRVSSISVTPNFNRPDDKDDSQIESYTVNFTLTEEFEIEVVDENNVGWIERYLIQSRQQLQFSVHGDPLILRKVSPRTLRQT